MDLATNSLKKILDGVRTGEYVVIPGVPVFDEHDEFGPDGKLVRRFGRNELQKIADTCNRREATSGDLTPFGPGHTIPNQYDRAGVLVRPSKEEDQPPVWGYYRNYRVDNFGPGGKVGLIADCYAKAAVADKVREDFPRRSIELYPQENLIDWVAHLRRSPRRDLGLLAYSRDEYARGLDRWCPWEKEPQLYSAPNRSRALAAVDRGGKLRYALESDMPLPDDPTRQPNVDVPTDDMLTPEEERTAERYMKHYMKRYPKMAQFAADAPAAAMSGPNGDAPMAPRPDGSNEYQDPGQKAMWARVDEVGGARTKTGEYDGEKMASMWSRDSLQGMTRDKQIERLIYERDAALIDRDLADLAGAGVKFDGEKEREFLLSLQPQQRVAHLERMATHYQREELSPIGGPIVPTAQAAGDGRYDGLSQDLHRKVMHYMRENPGVPYDRAREIVTK